MGRDSEKGKYASPKGSQLWEYIVTILCALGTCVVGCSIGWISPALAELAGPDNPNAISSEEASTIAGSLSIGSLPAPLLSLFIIDRIGKKKTILLSCLPSVFSWGLIVASRDTWVLIVARILSGSATGLFIFTLPLYMGEILSSNLRGSMMTATLITLNSGISFMLSVGPYLGTQVASGFCLAISICCFVGFLFVPESPYFLVSVSRIEEAKTALVKLRGKTDVAEEIEQIKITLCEKSETQLLQSSETAKPDGAKRKEENVFKQIFMIPGNRKAFFIMMLIFLLRHGSGLGSFLSYFEIIFRAMSGNIDLRRASMVFGLLQIISALGTFAIVDKFNRRTLLTVSGAALTFFLFVIGTYFFLIEYTAMDVKRYYLIPYFSVYIYVLVLNVAAIAVPAVIGSEILAPNVKGPISCIGGIAESIMGFAFVKIYLLSATSWGLGHSIPIWVFAIVTCLCVSTIVWMIPETRGKTLLEIQKSFNA